MENQIKLLAEYGIENYTIENGVIVIKRGVNLNHLKEVHKDLFKGVAIKGGLYLDGLQTVHKDFLIGIMNFIRSVKSSLAPNGSRLYLVPNFKNK